MSSKSLLKFKFISALVALETHKTIAWAGILMLALHIGSLFFDQYVHLNITEALVPFILKRNLTSAVGLNLSIPVAIGVVALYLLVTLLTTSVLKGKLVNRKVWRVIHYSSFAAYISFLTHGFLAGSDSTQPWMRAIYIASLTVVLTLLFARIFSKKLFYPKPKPIENADTISTT
jgi:cytochrome b561